MNSVFTELWKIAKANPEGFTVSLHNLKPITRGWVVALKETQNCFGPPGLQKAFDVAIKTSKIIGGWKNGKDYYFDACITFDNEADAIAAGKANEQIAIYQIETNTLRFL
jgi:hypothetical protein